MAIWKPLPSQSNKRAEWVFAGGVNTGNDSFNINDTQSVDEYGWDTDEDYPALATSKSPVALGTAGSGATRLITNFGNGSLIRQVGTVIQRWDGSSWVNIGTFSDTDADAANFDINGAVVIFTNGVDTPQYWNGTTMTNISGMPKGKYVTTDNLRVYTANAAGDDTPDIVHYSAFQSGTDWTSPENSGSVQFYTPNGGAITAILSFGGQIWVFKKDSYALIYHTGDFRNAYRLVPNTDGVGCVNYKTLVQVGETLYWLGQNDIFVGSMGASSRIGEPLRAYLNRLNVNQLSKCSAFTDGLRYYLNLVLDNATEPNYRFVYDTRKDQRIWRVAQINEQYRYGVLYDGVPYAGNAAGMTYKINAAPTTGAWMIETKDFDRSEAEKEYWELYNQCLFPTGSTLTLEASVDQGTTWYNIGDTMVSAPHAVNDPTIIPLDLLPLGYYVRFRFSGTGSFKLYGSQRYYRIQPIQY